MLFTQRADHRKNLDTAERTQEVQYEAPSFVGQMLVSAVNRSTSPQRPLQNSSSSRPGLCFVLFFGPGTRSTLASPASRVLLGEGAVHTGARTAACLIDPPRRR